jgi:hypothetical protein
MILAALMAVVMAMPMCGQYRMAQSDMVRVYGKAIVDLYSTGSVDDSSMRPDTVMPNGDWQKVVETQMSAKESFKYVRQALARLVPDYQGSVQLEDTASCKIIVTVPLPLAAYRTTERGKFEFIGTYDISLTLTMKDRRYRVSGEGTKCSYKVSMQGLAIDRVKGRDFGMANRLAGGTMLKDMPWRIGRLVYMIDSTMKKQKADDDF